MGIVVQTTDLITSRNELSAILSGLHTTTLACSVYVIDLNTDEAPIALILHISITGIGPGYGRSVFSQLNLFTVSVA